MNEKDENFLLALIAGEGCFSISHHIGDNYTYGVIPTFQFYISMKNDGEILKYFNNKTGLGSIKIYGQSTHWRINSKSGNIEFCNMIDNMDTHLFEKTTKWESYKKFRNALQKYEEDGVTKESIRKCAISSRKINPDGVKAKRSATELLDIIDRNG